MSLMWFFKHKKHVGAPIEALLPELSAIRKEIVMAKGKKGFAGMEKEKQKEIARKGGKSSHRGKRKSK